MKGKTKTQKGITLVALIITIVVLLILAVVAITAIQDEDLIGKVNSAATTYNESVNNESTQLGNYANIINGYLSNITAGGNGGQTGGSIVWTQSGTTITKGTQTLTVGQTITNYNAGVEGYTGGWQVLGVNNGKLLIVSSDIAYTFPDMLYYYLAELDGYKSFDEMADEFLNNQSAIDARPLSFTDVNVNSITDSFLGNGNGRYLLTGTPSVSCSSWKKDKFPDMEESWYSSNNCINYYELDCSMNQIHIAHCLDSICYYDSYTGPYDDYSASEPQGIRVVIELNDNFVPATN